MASTAATSKESCDSINETFPASDAESEIDQGDLPVDDSCVAVGITAALIVNRGDPDLVEDDEGEKAVLDPTLPPGTSRFSKAYSVVRGAVIVHDEVVLSSSPSFLFHKNRKACALTAAASFRLLMEFESGKRTTVTGFRIGPDIGLSAGHCVIGKHLNDRLLHVWAVSGDMVPQDSFRQVGDELAILHIERSFSKREANGLYVDGADFVLLKLPQRSDDFLLPCSPTSSTPVAVFSYPGVTSFLREAQQELTGGGQERTLQQKFEDAQEPKRKRLKTETSAGSVVGLSQTEISAGTVAGLSKTEPSAGTVAGLSRIWTQYGAMIQRTRATKGNLFDMLIDTFGQFTSGQLVCSVGLISECNSNSFSTTTSTLRGSSGAAVSSATDNSFRGIHSGGLPGFDYNVATSCDNPLFVAAYMAYVLPSLPSPAATTWACRKMGPYISWLMTHRDFIPPGSLWCQAGTRQDE